MKRDLHYDYGLFMTVLTVFLVPAPKVHNKKWMIPPHRRQFRIHFPLSRIAQRYLLHCAECFRSVLSLSVVATLVSACDRSNEAGKRSL